MSDALSPYMSDIYSSFFKKNRYVGSFFFPSSALMPVEYCLHLKEQETLEDLDSMRLLIRERLNLDLTIEPEA